MTPVRRIFEWVRAGFRPHSLDRRIAPHVPTELDERTGCWVDFSRSRWPA